MIDGLFKHHIDSWWEEAAKPLARLGMTANQVTLMGLVLVVGNSAAYLWHGSTLVFGLGLAISFAADSLDGAVARLRKQCTSAGSYLDAMVDRYQELVVLLALAYVNNVWPAAMVVLAGSLLTSYGKARCAIEMPIDNNQWPDLFERQERLVFICTLLVVDGLARSQFGIFLLPAGLWILAGLTNLTAVQRILRAWRILSETQSRC